MSAVSPPARRAERRRAAPPTPGSGAPWRWPVDLPARIQEQRSCAFDIRVLDLSLTGCRLWAGFRLRPLARAKLIVDGFAPFGATIMWSEHWFAALRFDQPLHLSVLRHLVACHPPGLEEPIIPRSGGESA